ncbi:MAG: SUMF1/EgtB/PvdO family nonheme iron enzyme [Chthoniobacteraceae bacterium]
MEYHAIPGLPVLFAIYETRVSDFQAFVQESGYEWNERPHFPQTGDHPVVNVNLQDAIAYCKWLTLREQKAGLITELQSYRLPMNGEWDAAVGLISARQRMVGVTQEVEETRTFPWGQEWPPPKRAGNFNSQEISGVDDGYVYTAPVGFFTPSEEGLFDLAGNVWEWAWDQEARVETFGTLRGGSWMYFRKECLLSNYRYQVAADLRSPSVGFRCVFEDKHFTAIFLADAAKAAKDQDQERRNKMATNPAVTAEEVEKMRESMERKPRTVAEVKLPDPTKLTPAKPGQPFQNTLGLNFRPLGDAPLLIGETEVRVQDYLAYATAAAKPWDKKPSFEMKDSHPIVNVTWQEAKAFCEWLTAKDRAANLISAQARYRLPTDAEWSEAAGLKDETGATPAEKDGANKVDFPWGRDPVPPLLSANLDTARMQGYQDNYSYTSPVGSFSPNGAHLYDIAGNVSEWCEDAWPGAAGERVVRGSSWLSSAPNTLLSSARQHLAETATLSSVGFRLMLELNVQP